MNHENPSLSATIAGGEDYLIGKLMKPKSRIELCETISWSDEELGDLTIFFRVVDTAESNSDNDMDAYSIECSKLGDEVITISSRLEETILRHLNESNPLGVKFQTRA